LTPQLAMDRVFIELVGTPVMNVSGVSLKLSRADPLAKIDAESVNHRVRTDFELGRRISETDDKSGLEVASPHMAHG
jgi:hypothetical protein